jgi:hypothetical protein
MGTSRKASDNPNILLGGDKEINDIEIGEFGSLKHTENRTYLTLLSSEVTLLIFGAPLLLR